MKISRRSLSIDIASHQQSALAPTAASGKVTSKIRNRPDIRHRLTESGVRQKITIRPYLIRMLICLGDRKFLWQAITAVCRYMCKLCRKETLWCYNAYTYLCIGLLLSTDRICSCRGLLSIWWIRRLQSNNTELRLVTMRGITVFGIGSLSFDISVSLQVLLNWSSHNLSQTCWLASVLCFVFWVINTQASYGDVKLWHSMCFIWARWTWTQCLCFVSCSTVLLISQTTLVQLGNSAVHVVRNGRALACDICIDTFLSDFSIYIGLF